MEIKERTALSKFITQVVCISYFAILKIIGIAFASVYIVLVVLLLVVVYLLFLF
jgi:hypothetical protein